MNHASMLVVFITVIILALCSPFSSSRSEEKTKIGIMEFDVPKNLDPAFGGFLYDMLLERMVASGKYTVVDWEEIDRVLKYVSQSQPNISDEDARRQAVDQLGIEKMYLGSLRKVGSKYYVSVKVLNLDLTVSRVVRESTRREDELERVIDNLASKLILSPEELAEANQKAAASRNISGNKGRLYVRTTPTDALVRILNIKPRYRDGMELEAGDYHVEVSMRGFVTERRWINVSPGTDNEVAIQLAARASEPQPGEIWREPVTGMEFVWIPGGCFRMGSPVGESGRHGDEGPEHEVCVDGFWMGKTEVTNKQYRNSQSGHKSKSYKRYSLDGNKQPVVRVSWYDAKAFGEWLKNQNAGHYQFRLPTEAEWEYACRAGRQTARFWGSDPDHACRYANIMDPSARRALAERSAHNCEDGYKVSSPVGSFQSNGFGLYDTLGNVMEWCEDIYNKDAYIAHFRKNPTYMSGGSHRVMRGGSWSCGPNKVRCAYRERDKPGSLFPDVGFRLVRMP